MKPVTIPTLELTVASVSIKVSSMLQRELEYGEVVEWFWTDSSVVLVYIKNDSRRFCIFVANRVQQIREHSDPSQWRYVKTNENPADIASWGATAEALLKSCWFDGPKFWLRGNFHPMIWNVWLQLCLLMTQLQWNQKGVRLLLFEMAKSQESNCFYSKIQVHI